MKKVGDAAIAAADKVSLTNLFGASLFKHVEIQINETQVSDSTSSNYGYKAIIETLLSYGNDAKDTHLQSALFYKDTAGKMAGYDVNNTGLKARKDVITNGSFEFETAIYNDFLQTYKLLPSAVRLRIKFVRQNDSFVLIADQDNYKINIKNLRLFVKKIRIKEEIIQFHRNKFANDKFAVFPVARSQIKTFVLRTGVNSEVIPNVIKGHLPRNVIIALVDSAAFNGAVAKNPYNFQHFKVQNISIGVNGLAYPRSAYNLDFEKRKAIRAYKAMFDSNGMYNSNTGNDISYDDFLKGYTFFCYDISPDACNGFHLHRTEIGVLNVDVTFQEALEVPVNMIVYCCYDNNVYMDKFSNVTTDFQV